MIAVVTWNVLHRIHAENWGEAVAAHWPDESARIAAITKRIAARTEQVIALQEVSGDQLASLRTAMPGRTVHAFRYPRMPNPRRGTNQLTDPSEHLVLLVDGPSREVSAESFTHDLGKGALAVEINATLVIATHISVDRRRTPELSRLAELATGWSGPSAVLLGDFNAERAVVAAGLGAGFTVAEPQAGSLSTRASTSNSAPQWIDHVVTRGALASDTTVEDTDGLSDHNLVRADIADLPN